MEIGLIGLGNMGRNLAKNLDDKGYKVHVYNRTTSKTLDLVKSNPNIIPHYSISELVDGINGKNKVVLLMLTAGKIIDQVLENLNSLLKEDDVVVDIGNSFFKDTIRREELYHFQFVGAGISGGELGARYGGSITVGCKISTWNIIKHILSDISSDSEISDGKCCQRFGDNGAGHFVKMVHNGIEYCDMDIIGETYKIFKYLGEDNDQISETFHDWNNNELKSYLLEISAKILQKKHDDKYLIDEIEDSAQQKGTGKDCITEAVELSVPTITIVAATFSRMISARIDVRKNLNKHLKFNSQPSNKLSKETLKKSMYLCRATSYIQGFNLIKAAINNYNWHNDLNLVCDVWSNGCILRGSFLKTMQKIVSETGQDFEKSETFYDIFNKNIESLQEVVIYAAKNGIPIPAISSCFNYLNSVRDIKSYGNMIQAMRDCFGGHTVIFKGEHEGVHIDWLNK